MDQEKSKSKHSTSVRKQFVLAARSRNEFMRTDRGGEKCFRGRVSAAKLLCMHQYCWQEKIYGVWCVVPVLAARK